MEEAKRLLKYYFRDHFSNSDVDVDIEIDQIVDDIIKTAVDQAVLVMTSKLTPAAFGHIVPGPVPLTDLELLESFQNMLVTKCNIHKPREGWFEKFNQYIEGFKEVLETELETELEDELENNQADPSKPVPVELRHRSWTDLKWPTRHWPCPNCSESNDAPLTICNRCQTEVSYITPVYLRNFRGALRWNCPNKECVYSNAPPLTICDGCQTKVSYTVPSEVKISDSIPLPPQRRPMKGFEEVMGQPINKNMIDSIASMKPTLSEIEQALHDPATFKQTVIRDDLSHEQVVKPEAYIMYKRKGEPDIFITEKHNFGDETSIIVDSMTEMGETWFFTRKNMTRAEFKRLRFIEDGNTFGCEVRALN